jgi:pseudouridine-5'-phosphate glycosidase
MEAIVRTGGAVPATIAVLDGRLCVGLENADLEQLASDTAANKASSRDLAALIASTTNGGTTVAGTLRVAAIAGIRVFATGGMGGVHRGSQWDVSADLYELAKQPVVLVSAGVKAILDIPATLELLETLGVPVVGYGTGHFPAFYSVSSSLPTSTRVDTPAQAAELARTHWELGGGGVLLANPLPADAAIPNSEVEQWIEAAHKEAEQQGISGQAVSPYLLKRVSELSQGRSLQANLALLNNNARLAAEVATELTLNKTRQL